MAPLPLSGFIPAAIALMLWSCARRHCAMFAAAVSNESDALVSEHRRIVTAFKQEIVDDPNGALATWRASRHVCRWKGVSCAAGGGGRVVALELPGQGLNGTLTPLLFTMPFLTHLNLSSNGFKGGFPDVLKAGNGSAGGSTVVSLDLSGNLSSGILPDSIGTLSELKVLLLGTNDFSGPIPSALGRCNKLVSLELGTASDGQSPSKRNGAIPGTLANCSSLTLLRLSYANLTGPVLAWLGSLKELQVLDLAANSLTGGIPASLGNLTGLAVLSLMDNAYLPGKLPAELRFCSNLMSLSLGMTLGDTLRLDDRNEIGGTLESLYGEVLSNMTFLERLVVSGTHVTGVIPHELGTTLRGLVHLELQANRLEGEIPRTLGNLSNLEYVDLTFNDFRGTIPGEFGLCTRLETFALGTSSDINSGLRLSNVDANTWLRNMALVGSIPQEFGRLPFLNTFLVTDTGIGGEIPDFSNCTALVSLRLTNNELNGNVLAHFFPSSLERLRMEFNRLTGPIPRALGNFSNLLSLQMPYNDIEGPIPREIAFCKKLQLLELGGSSISRGPRRSMIRASIPKELGQLKDLHILGEESTEVYGMIPSSLRNCTSMVTLLLNDNNLSGGLPTWLANMTSLQTFSGASNQLEGPLSTIDWSGLQLLRELILSRNNFSSDLPPSLGMTSKLRVFMVSEANLVGTIPRSYRNCSALHTVDLQNNQLSGDISNALDVLCDTASGLSMKVILLSSNKFEGSLPPCIGSRFMSLSILVLAGNLIQGSIPSGLSQFASLQKVQNQTGFIYRVVNQVTDPPMFLTYKNVTRGHYSLPLSTTILDLSNNHLQGEIPQELSSLVGLRYLNLSYNQLVGSIPLTFSNLSSLVQMDLSNNNLSGTIPGVFANLPTIEYVNFSNNNLVGLVPFGTRFDSQSYLGNLGLCGQILNIACSIAQTPQANLSPSSSYVSSRHRDPPLSWTGFSIGCVTSFLIVIGLFLSTSRGLHFIFGDSGPPIYILKHGFYHAPL